MCFLTPRLLLWGFALGGLADVKQDYQSRLLLSFADQSSSLFRFQEQRCRRTWRSLSSLGFFLCCNSLSSQYKLFGTTCVPYCVFVLGYWIVLIGFFRLFQRSGGSTAGNRQPIYTTRTSIECVT